MALLGRLWSVFFFLNLPVNCTQSCLWYILQVSSVWLMSSVWSVMSHLLPGPPCVQEHLENDLIPLFIETLQHIMLSAWLLFVCASCVLWLILIKRTFCDLGLVTKKGLYYCLHFNIIQHKFPCHPSSGKRRGYSPVWPQWCQFRVHMKVLKHAVIADASAVHQTSMQKWQKPSKASYLT